jgi:hypothetical protein
LRQRQFAAALLDLWGVAAPAGENLAAMIGMGIDPADAVQQAIVNW